jgi:hypothetical protein
VEEGDLLGRLTAVEILNNNVFKFYDESEATLYYHIWTYNPRFYSPFMMKEREEPVSTHFKPI